jgi:ubiquinol-cytochrome c reductase cytochrome c subunit
MRKALFVFALTAGLASAQNAEKGKALFLKNNCYSCHGFDGHGGGAGVKLAPKPIALAAFIAYVRHPALGSMPTFSAKVISDADLTDIRAYLATIPDPPAVKDVPLLNQ